MGLIEELLDIVPKAYATIAGVQIDVFTVLHDGPLPGDELVQRVRVEPRRLQSLFLGDGK